MEKSEWRFGGPRVWGDLRCLALPRQKGLVRGGVQKAIITESRYTLPHCGFRLKQAAFKSPKPTLTSNPASLRCQT